MIIGTLFQMNHFSQLQIDVLKSTERNISGDKADASLEKALHKSTQTRSNWHFQKPTYFRQITENGAASYNILQLLHLSGQWPFLHSELTAD